MLESLLPPPGVVPVLINPIAVLLAVLPGIFMALLSLLKPRSLKAGVIMLWRMKLQVILLAAVLFGLRFGVKALWPDSGAAAGEVEVSDRDWPLFRGGARRRGWVEDGSADPVRGGINWTFREDNKQSFLASPAVRGNRIYIPSVTVGVFGGLNGAIYCFDTDTGAMVWRGGPADYRGSFSSAVVEGDFLVVGEGLHITEDARAVCMDISDESNPVVRWTFRTHSHIEGTPAIEDGRVFFTAGNDGIYGLDLESGEELWHLPGEEHHDPETAILAHDGRVYIGLGFGVNGQAVLQVDAETGQVLHRIETPYPVFGAPAAHEGIVYVGMGNGDFVFPAAERVDYVLDLLEKQGMPAEEREARRAQLGPGGAVWAFDTETMERLWEFETANTVLSSVTSTDEGIYFATRGGTVYHLDDAGNEIASRNLGEPVMSSMSVTDQHVMLMTAGGTVFVLRSGDLSMVWEFSLGTGTMNFSSPAVARGHIFVGTETLGMVSLGEPDDGDRVEVWSGPGGGRADEDPIPALGAYESHEPEAAGGSGGRTLLSIAPLAVNGEQVRIFDPPELRVVIGSGDSRRSFPLSAAATEVAAVGDVLAVITKGEMSRLELIQTVDGSSIAQFTLEPGIPPLLSADATGFRIQRKEGMTWIDPAGEVRSILPVSGFTFVPEIEPHQVTGIRDAGRQLAVLDAPTGKTLWQQKLPAAATGPAHRAGGWILVPTRGGVKAFDRLTGSEHPDWRAPNDAASPYLITDRSLMVSVTAAGELLVLDAATGEERARHPGALPDIRPFFGRDRLFWAGPDALFTLNQNRPQDPPETWVDISWIGRPTTHPLALDGALYMGCEDWGLVTFGGRR